MLGANSIPKQRLGCGNTARLPVQVDLLQLLQQGLVVRNTLLDKSNRTVRIQQVRHTSPLEQSADRTVGITDQRELQAMLLDKRLMGLERIATDAQNLGILLFKGRQVLLKSKQFILSDRGEIGVIEGQHDIPAAKIRQMDQPLG